MRHRGDMLGRWGEPDPHRPQLGARPGRAGAMLARDTRGAGLVEYMVLVGFIAVAALAAFRAFGSSVHSKVEAQAACVTSLSCGAGQSDYALTSPDLTMALTAPTVETPLPLAAVTPDPESTPTPAPSGETTPSIEHKAWYDYIWNGLGGFFRDGLWSDLYGLYELVSDIPGTAVALWDLGRMLVQGSQFLPDGSMRPNPFYDHEQAEKLAQLLDVVGESIEDYYVDHTDRAVGRTIYEVITLVVAPAKILKIAKAKWLARASKVTKVDKSTEVLTEAEKLAQKTKQAEEIAEQTKTAEKIAEGTKDTEKVLSEVEQAWKATNLDIDPVTMAQLEKYGLKPDSVVYRVMDEEYLDTKNMRVSGNPRSVAEVKDPYNLVDDDHLKALEDLGVEVPPNVPRRVPSVKNADQLDKPGLNVAVDDPSLYNPKGDKVKIAVRIEDVIRNGGKVYPDRGSTVPGIRPIYVTFDGSVPYTRVP
jgi:pilus assembly protein Flp/PilA